MSQNPEHNSKHSLIIHQKAEKNVWARQAEDDDFEACEINDEINISTNNEHVY